MTVIVPPHVRIATETEEVVKEIKNTRSILNDVVEPFPNLSELERFAVYHYWSDSESVNVFQVKGVFCCPRCYPASIPWIDLLLGSKKMRSNLELLAKNPDYYFECKKKEPPIRYTRINDNIYVSGDGVCRTAIAKVLFYYTGCYILHGVDCDFLSMPEGIELPGVGCMPPNGLHWCEQPFDPSPEGLPVGTVTWVPTTPQDLPCGDT